MFDEFGSNLDFASFDRLLRKDDIIEEPIPIDRFATDKHYLGLSNGLSPIQLELAKHVTQIFKLPTLVKLYGEEEAMRRYKAYTVNEVVAMVGKGGGKDYTSRICFAYIVYLMHCMRDPLEYYGKDYGTTIVLLNLAVNSQQANRVFFEPLKNLILRSEYFNEHAPCEPRVGELRFFNRPVACVSGHSESEGWEGYDLHTVVLDEIAAFKTDVELKTESARARGSASQIYNMSKFSVMSRFPEVGKVVLLSFPRFAGDFITQKYAEATSIDVPKTWAIKAATYEMNPTITRESLESEYIRNPVDAAARFECLPPLMEDAYFKEPERVRSAFNYSDNPVKEDGTWEEWFNGSDGLPRFIHVDLGLKRDACGLVMVHATGIKEVNINGLVESLPIVNVDYVHSWKAGANEEINFSDVRQMILDLSRKFSVGLVSFDHWNSADMIQALRAANISTDAFVVKKIQYDTLSTAIYDGRLRGYWHEQLVDNELLRLKLINGLKIDHPSTGEKDIADSLAGAVWTCFKHFDQAPDMEIEVWDSEMDAEIDEDFFQAKQEQDKRPVWTPQREIPQDLQDWVMESI